MRRHASCKARLGNEKCKNNGQVALDGVTVILLGTSWVPDEAFTGGATSDVPHSDVRLGVLFGEVVPG